VGGDWTNFTGLISVGPKSAADEFRINNFGFPNADLYLSNGVTMYNIGGNNRLIDLGGLAGDTGAILGPGNANSTGPTWRVGGKNTTNTFAGLINDAGTTSLIKAGSGKWILTGANAYSGATTISNGVLSLKDEGSISNSLTINIVSNAVLEVSERVDGTLTLNGTQTLMGEGTLQGSLIAGSGTVVSPGADAGLIGRLTITNALILQEGSTLQVDVDGEARTCDTLVGMARVTYGGTLSLNGTFAADTNLKLFTAAAYSGAFASIVPDPPGQDLKWDTTQLTVSGTLKVVSTVVRPTIGAFQVVGTNLVVHGTGGTPSGSFEVLTSPEVALPLSQWTVATTGQFDASGNFSFTVPIDPKQARRFYAVKM
jgi:autotransporter-associated beta strand protein